MVSKELRRKIRDNKRQIHEPFCLTERVIIPGGRDYVVATYLDLYLSASESAKDALIDELFQGWVKWGKHLGYGHKNVRSWGRAVIGASYLFRFSTVEEVRASGKLNLAADAIVRVSRWFQSTRPPYGAMNSHATRLVRRIWGNIEDLRRMETVCERAAAEGPVRSRPEFQFKPEVASRISSRAMEDALVRMRQQEQPAQAGEPGAESGGEAPAVAQKPLWEVIAEIARRVPDEEWAKIPSDASYQLDHYLYGAPKKPAP